MSVRKHRGKWLVTIRLPDKTTKYQTFRLRKEADAYDLEKRGAIAKGDYVPDSKTVTVAEAASLWLEAGRTADPPLERSTLEGREQHINRHINPFIGTMKISELTRSSVKAWQAQLTAQGRSANMIRRVTVSLGAILAEAQDRELIRHNVVYEMRQKKGKRQKRTKLQIGRDIPSPDEIRAFIAALAQFPRLRPLFLVAIFSGLRASELRGLRWSDVDLNNGVVHVRQRADRWGKIGDPKSEAGTRSVPLPPIVINTLREWKLIYPKPEHFGKPEAHSPEHLVFPSETGRPQHLRNIVRGGLWPVWLTAKVTRTVRDKKTGATVAEAKYRGLHAFRHFFASWSLARVVDGGLGLPLQLVKERLGHSSITLTADTYGHLLPSQDDGKEMAAAAEKLF